MRILLDYRPALRARTGVGEFVHELARALAQPTPATSDELVLLTSSWKDRPSSSLASEVPGARIVDRRIPVRVLTWSWNRLRWPPVDWLAGAADVIHSPTPLLIPANRGAQVITIHDLDFLRHPDRLVAEMRRDFPRLAADHAARADHVLAVSRYTANQVVQSFGLPPSRVTVCSLGAPSWAGRIAQQRAATNGGSHVLFVGTLEPRKNPGAVLEAFALVRARRPDIGDLMIAGRAGNAAQPWIDRAQRTDLAGHVRLLGYVSDDTRRQLYRDARMLVLPSFEEGFGLPVLDAMACGVPVVISNRGALPEVAGAAATPVDPDDVEGLARQMELLLDPDAARAAIARGLTQAAKFTWENCARAVRDAYHQAIARHAELAA